jgi:hypothetical protein
MSMTTKRLNIKIDVGLLNEIDLQVRQREFTNRREAIEHLLKIYIAKFSRRTFATECAKFDAKEEQAFAEAGCGSTLNGWPRY